MSYDAVHPGKKACAIYLLLSSIPSEVQREIRIAHRMSPDQWWRWPTFHFAKLAWKQLLASRDFDDLSEFCIPLVEEALSLR